MKIENYLDATYLKTSEMLGITEAQNYEITKNLAMEALAYNYFALMILPHYVKEIKEFLLSRNSKIIVGTVIDFPLGKSTLENKIVEVEYAIKTGVDEIDVVINYSAFLDHDVQLVKKEFIQLSQIALQNHKTIKWIIEIAALSHEQIKEICINLSAWAKEEFEEQDLQNIFIKSSTGFYKTTDNTPKGATPEAIALMLKYGFPLPIKAAGGIKTHEEAKKMIQLGVQRIGTSSPKDLLEKRNQ